MTHSEKRRKQPDKLRRQAEAMACEEILSVEKIATLSPEEIQQTFRELRVHQIQLEMQNEELRQTQMDLNTARTHYFDLYDLAPAGYLTISNDGLIQDANLTAATLLGVTRKTLLNQPFSRFIFKDDQNLFSLHRQQNFETDEMKVCELRLMKQEDETPFWVQLAVIGTQQAGGAIGCRVVVSDIIARKRAEEALLESEARFRKVLQDVQSVAVRGYGPDGTTQYWNHASELLYGYSAQEAIGRNLMDLIVPSEIRKDVEQAIRQMVATGQPIPASELSLKRKDGSRVAVFSCHTIVQVPGRERELFCIDIDLTERKQMEEALRESEERLHAAAKAANFGVYSYDFVSGRPYYSSEFLALFGMPPCTSQELNRAMVAKALHPEDKPGLLARLKIANYPGSSGILEHECRIIRLDGQTRWLRVIGKTIFNDGPTDHPLRANGIIQDITERKQKEAYREMGREILQILNEPGELSDSIPHVLDELKTRTGLDAVGIRLQEGDDFPYYAQKGYPQSLYLTCRSPKQRTAVDSVSRNKDGSIKLECACGLVVSGETRSDPLLFTPGGSFWTNDSSSLHSLSSRNDPRFRSCNQCIHQGYASFALVPIRDKEKIVGLLQFNDQRKGCFTSDTIEILEGIATHLGTALMRKQAEEALKQSELKRSKAQEAANAQLKEQAENLVSIYQALDSIGLIVSDLEENDARITIINPGAEKMLGYRKEEMIGKSISFIYPHEFEGIVPARIRKLRQGKAIHSLDLTLVRKSGERFPAVVSVHPFARHGRRFTKTVGVIRDISDLMRVQNQLEATNIELERRVEQRTLELQEAQKQYLHAEKLSAIGKLSASIAHEFNNPLQGILSILKGLKKRAIVEEEDRELLETAINESNRMKGLIRSLQDFNRPSAHKKVFMDVHHALDAMLLLHKSDFKHKRIGVERDYAVGVPHIQAIPDQIKQVFLNLLTNAADACSRSGGVITVSTRQEGDRVGVAIKDTGIGIQPEDMEQIFQPFFTTKPAVKGTGLGLSVSYGIVKHHQGEIRVESRPGEGATFTVLLPIESTQDTSQG